MFNAMNPSQPNDSTAASRVIGIRPVILAWCGAALFLLTSCTVIPRLDANFEADTVGAQPSSTPAPTPPEDSLGWRTGFVASMVVATPDGRWVRVAPLPAFTASPDDRRVFLIAVTEAFTTNPPANIRGSVRLRLVGLGTVGLALRPVQAEQTLDFIGGFELSNFLPPSGGSVNVLQSFRSDRLGDLFGLPSSGTISGYTTGNVIDINWTIDQPSRTFSASVLGGPSQSSTFPAQSAGNNTTPIQRLSLQLWMQKPTTDTVLFIDNLRAEEYR